MVEDAVRDGERIGELLSSEVHGHERGALGDLSVADADRDAEATPDGTFAYAVEFEPSVPPGGTGPSAGRGTVGRRVAEAYLHPDRLRVEFLAGREAAVEAAEAEGLNARRVVDGGDPGAEERAGTADARPRVAVTVDSGAAVKPALRVVRAVAESIREEIGEP